MIQRQGTNQEINHNENQLAQNNQQGNYSLRRPPKLIIPQAVILKAMRKDGLFYKQSVICTQQNHAFE